MPIDRTTNNTSRPLKPTLATARTVKTPVTPRLAQSTTSTPQSRTARSTAGSIPRVAAAAQDDVTPVKNLINSNVTPRSSSRKSRVGGGSANSTPNGTPSGTPVASRFPPPIVDPAQKEQGSGHANGMLAPQRRPRSIVGQNNHPIPSTPRLPLSNIYSHVPDTAGLRGASSPMFFHANEAHAQEPQPQPQAQKKAPVFFYANGEQDESLRSLTVPSPPLSAVGRMQAESKFFHVDSLCESRGPPVPTPPPISSPEPWSNPQLAESQHTLRPPSPAKENIHLSYRKGASQVIRPNLQSRSSALSILSGSHTSDTGEDTSRRRSSATSAVRFNHTKSASLSSIDSTHSLRKGPSPDAPHIAPSPLHNEKRIVSNISLPDSVSSLPQEPTNGILSPNPLSPAMPGPGQSMLEHMNELAANARRERKVLDLEISNNSLLAINRSLEREMRKQKAELRRFRRMSRAGQFSADTLSHVEVFSAVGAADVGDLSDMSEEEEPEEPEEPETEELSDSSLDESLASDSALAERDEAHRLRDEKRLRLDLAKHRELLVDSQKMNQSLKRCLNWTEELIKDGQKALAYKVRASDVQLGGRVLSSEEQPEDERDEESKTLLSPWNPPDRPMNPIDADFPHWAADRDSGVALDGVKQITSGLQGFITPLASPSLP